MFACVHACTLKAVNWLSAQTGGDGQRPEGAGF